MKSDEHKKKILIVEDSKTQALKLQLLLQDQGYDVALAMDGKEGFKAARKLKPDLIFSDVQMPIMNGFEMCSKIKMDKTLRHIPIVLLTVLVYPDDIIQGLQAGTDYYLTKPYNDDFLIKRVKSILSSHSSNKNKGAEIKANVEIEGQDVKFTMNSQQIISLLFSTFENAAQTKLELSQSQRELKTFYNKLEEQLHEAQEKIITLKELLPICASCKKIRDDDGYWNQIESYISENTDTKFSHGICPDCMKELYPDIHKKMKDKENKV